MNSNTSPLPDFFIGVKTLVVLIIACFVPARSQGGETGFAIRKTSDAIAVERKDGAAVLRYQLQRPSESKLPVDSGGYFHPVQTPKGVLMTEVAPADHVHHRGIFLAWVEMHGVKDADFWGWGAHAPKVGRRIINRDTFGLKADENGAGFGVRNDWVADGIVMMKEEMKARVQNVPPAYVLDLTYTITASSDVLLSRWAFSGFCVRTRKDGELTASSPLGVVELSNPKHTEPASDWPAAEWYGYTLKLEKGDVAGIAVIDHPANPPTLWHNHRDVRMLNPCIVAPGEVRLKQDQPLTLRYRVVIHDGPAKRELLNSLALDWRKN